ncbi:MAG TPA: hypothetical protein VIR38_14090 [Thalassobaculum sp.]
MRHVLKPTALVVLCGLAAGCATAEYAAEERTCYLEWAGKIPPQIEQVLVNRTRSVEMPDGSMTCKTDGNTQTCKPGTRMVQVPYTEVATVDVNHDARQRAVARCAEAACLQRHGNTACKT